MTNDEAIYTLKNTAFLGWSEQAEKVEEAVRMAVKALKAQLTEKDTTSDCISRRGAIDIATDLRACISVDGCWAWIERLKKLPPAQPEPCEDAVSRHRLLNDLKELIAAWEKYPVMAEQIKGVETAIGYVQKIPSAQPKPLSDTYMTAVWTWLLDYQIKAAELKGRYTPYEVLSWVANDWRKEHEGSD